MSDQAEALRKRREARQKKILASGESRLSKITGTAGTSAQVAPSPAVLQAREQLLKKEQEEERVKTLRAAGVNVDEIARSNSRSSQLSKEDEGEELTMPSQRSGGASRINRQNSSSPTTTTSTTTTTSSTNNNTTTTTNTTTTSSTVHDADADPDDSLGAPPAHIPSQSDPFMSFSQHQQALTRMMQDSNGSNGSNRSRSTTMQQQQQQNPFGNTPPGFTVLTPQVDLTARWWKLLHFVMSALLGFAVVYREYSRQGDLGRFDALATEKPLPYGVFQSSQIPVFWYFVTMELLLQSTRMFLHGVTASPGGILATIAGFLPPPLADAIRVFMRYRLIWSSLVNDMSVVVFIIGSAIVFTHMFS